MFKIGDKIVLKGWSPEHSIIPDDLDVPFKFGVVYTIRHMDVYSRSEIDMVYVEGISDWYVPSDIIELALLKPKDIDRAIKLVNKRIKEVICSKQVTK